jgi:hypothetical protein
MLKAQRRNGESDVPLTLVRTSESESAQVAVMDLEVAVDSGTAPRQVRPPRDIVEEWGMQSFPASDPPANW